MTTDNQNSPVAPQGVVAWMTPEGDRVVTAETMDGARKDGGASLSSLRPYTVALVRGAVAPALEAPAGPTLVGDEQADSYLAEPGRLATLARSHPAGLVRALARAALAAAPQAPSGVLGWVHPQWAVEQGRGRIYGHNPGGYIAVQIASPQAPAAPAVDANGAVPVVLGKKLFQFSCHQDWVNRAQRAWKMAGVRSEDTICLDQKGRVLRKGLEFARADKEGAFPVVVYLALVDDTAAHDAWLAAQAAAKGASDE